MAGSRQHPQRARAAMSRLAQALLAAAVGALLTVEASGAAFQVQTSALRVRDPPSIRGSYESAVGDVRRPAELDRPLRCCHCRDFELRLIRAPRASTAPPPHCRARARARALFAELSFESSTDRLRLLCPPCSLVFLSTGAHWLARSSTTPPTRWRAARRRSPLRARLSSACLGRNLRRSPVSSTRPALAFSHNDDQR